MQIQLGNFRIENSIIPARYHEYNDEDRPCIKISCKIKEQIGGMNSDTYRTITSSRKIAGDWPDDSYILQLYDMLGKFIEENNITMSKK